MSTEGKTEAITRITTERGWLGHHAVTLMCGEAWDAAIGPLVKALRAIIGEVDGIYENDLTHAEKKIRGHAKEALTAVGLKTTI